MSHLFSSSPQLSLVLNNITDNILTTFAILFTITNESCLPCCAFFFFWAGVWHGGPESSATETEENT